MTRPHVHRWELGEPVGRDVWGQCACREVRRFNAYIPADAAQRHHVHRPSRAQDEESRALMSHAQSLAAS